MMKDGEVDIVITEEDFRHYWRRAREQTASSFSRLYFGHYKAAAYSKYLSEVHALKLSLIAQTLTNRFRSGEMGQRSVGDALEDCWGSNRDETPGDTADGGGFQLP